MWSITTRSKAAISNRQCWRAPQVRAASRANLCNALVIERPSDQGNLMVAGELASITGPITTWRYWRRERFAHVTVATAEGECEASVTRAVDPPPVPQLPIRGVSVKASPTVYSYTGLDLRAWRPRLPLSTRVVQHIRVWAG